VIELYAFSTPNSVKVPIALEELGLPYALHPVNIREGAQRTPEFIAMNRNAKVPVLVDEEGSIILAESAAILVYLAEKTGRLLPAAGASRARVFEQLFFHASALSPAFGQAGYFQKLAPAPLPHAIERFRAEAKRVLGVLEARLSTDEFVAGAEMSIADIAHYGWLWRREFAGIELDDTPHVARWFAALDARPAFRRGVARTVALANPPPGSQP
jgi:glutathione S-transferase